MNRPLRVGSLVYATDQGLGILAKAFVDHGVVTNVLRIRHSRHPNHDEWYPGTREVTNLRATDQLELMQNFCASMDVCLFFETPFEWSLIDHCKKHKVKTILMTMYECTPRHIPSSPPNFFLCPSLLDFEYFREPGPARFIPVPVDVPWKLRARAEVFIHNAGHGGLKGRNGTAEVLMAVQHLKSPARILIRSQGPLGTVTTGRLTTKCGTVPYDELYSIGDVFLFPEKFNGLSLPLQEAHASGMLVMAGDRHPMNTWLPTTPLIPVQKYEKSRVGPPYLEFDEAVYDPKVIAATIDEWYGADIRHLSLMGKEWAEKHSWPVLLPEYMNLLKELP